LAAELVALPVDVIVSEGVSMDAVDPSGHIPIVGPALMDPVERGFAVSLARPGRHITSFTLMHKELNGKRLELLHAAFPQITAVSVFLRDPALSRRRATFRVSASSGWGEANGRRCSTRSGRACTISATSRAAT
jgi:putative ABC transport system substrate-binding protein